MFSGSFIQDDLKGSKNFPNEGKSTQVSEAVLGNMREQGETTSLAAEGEEAQPEFRQGAHTGLPFDLGAQCEGQAVTTSSGNSRAVTLRMLIRSALRLPNCLSQTLFHLSGHISPRKPEAEFYSVLCDSYQPVQSAHLCGVPAGEVSRGRAGLSCLLSASLHVESMHHEVIALREVL